MAQTSSYRITMKLYVAAFQSIAIFATVAKTPVSVAKILHPKTAIAGLLSPPRSSKSFTLAPNPNNIGSKMVSGMLVKEPISAVKSWKKGTA